MQQEKEKRISSHPISILKEKDGERAEKERKKERKWEREEAGW